MRTVVALLMLVGAMTGCREPDWQIIDLPSSPENTFKAEARVLSEGGALHIARRSEDWSEEDWLALGQCSRASFYWSDKRTAVFAYDKAEVTYFVDEPKYWGGAQVRICNRLTTTCPKPISEVIPIPGCDDHSM